MHEREDGTGVLLRDPERAWIIGDPQGYFSEPGCDGKGAEKGEKEKELLPGADSRHGIRSCEQG